MAEDKYDQLLKAIEENGLINRQEEALMKGTADKIEELSSRANETDQRLADLNESIRGFESFQANRAAAYDASLADLKVEIALNRDKFTEMMDKFATKKDFEQINRVLHGNPSDVESEGLIDMVRDNKKELAVVKSWGTRAMAVFTVVTGGLLLETLKSFVGGDGT